MSAFSSFMLELLSLLIRQTAASCLMLTHADVATAVQQVSVGKTH